MKLVYITDSDLWDSTMVGVKSKILNQIRCFEKNHIDVYLIALRGHRLCLIYKNKIVHKNIVLSRKQMFENMRKMVAFTGADKIYVRNIYCSKEYINFLKELKKNKKYVIIEYPTYPYDNEFNKDSLILKQDIFFRKKVKYYINLCTNYNNFRTIFGIKSIPLINGVNLGDIPIIHKEKHEDFVMIGVATMRLWHGYDRLIKGMIQYYNDNKNAIPVKLLLVGDGEEISQYKELVNNGGIHEYVSFKGKVTGRQLDELYNNADMAVGSLGMCRIGLKLVDPIKTKEYCARGIPFIIGYNDVAFPVLQKFIYKVPNDESIINIMDIIEFYNRCDNPDISKEMRKYAEENLTWDSILIPVINKIKK